MQGRGVSCIVVTYKHSVLDIRHIIRLHEISYQSYRMLQDLWPAKIDSIVLNFYNVLLGISNRRLVENRKSRMKSPLSQHPRRAHLSRRRPWQLWPLTPRIPLRPRRPLLLTMGRLMKLPDGGVICSRNRLGGRMNCGGRIALYRERNGGSRGEDRQVLALHPMC